MNKITGIIIAKNEQELIKNAIKSISFCSQIIVVDNNSTDKTKEASESLGAKVYSIASENFSELRNFGLEKALSEWVLYLDADERIDKVLQKEIEDNLSDENFSAFILKRKNFYLGNNQWPYIEKIIRIFRKKDLEKWIGEIHESPVVKGKIGILNGFINHYTHRDLESMVEKTLSWSTTEALIRFKSNHPKIVWWRFPRVMFTAFFNSYILQGGYKAKTMGIIESMYQAFSIFITYAKLWEMQNKIENQSVSKRTKIKTSA